MLWQFTFGDLYNKLRGEGINPSLPGPGTTKIPFFDPGTNAFIKPADIISAILPYILVISGIVLFVFLIMGGFELLTSAGNPETTKKAQGKITSAIIGFLLVFLAYWLAQILEVIFGIQIF